MKKKLKEILTNFFVLAFLKQYSNIQMFLMKRKKIQFERQNFC